MTQQLASELRGPSLVVKTGGRLVKHARYYWLLLAEGHVTRRLFGDMLRRWAAFGCIKGPSGAGKSEIPA